MQASAELIEAAERATLAALSPVAMEELDGWLLPYEPSVVGRAKSAVPLRHRNVTPAHVEEIISRYRARGLAPRFRLADVPGLDALHAALTQRGFTPVTPTRVEFGTLAALISLATPSRGRVLELLDATWRDAFLSAGAHDRTEEESRLAILQRNPDSLFAEVRDGAEVLSMGTAHVGLGLLSLHGIRTAPQARGRGLAAHVLAALGGVGVARGAEHTLLQVEEDNHAARALYARAGFRHAWTYRYWIER